MEVNGLIYSTRGDNKIFWFKLKNNIQELDGENFKIFLTKLKEDLGKSKYIPRSCLAHTHTQPSPKDYPLCLTAFILELHKKILELIFRKK